MRLLFASLLLACGLAFGEDGNETVEEIPWHVMHKIKSTVRTKQDLHGMFRIRNDTLATTTLPPMIRRTSFRSLGGAFPSASRSRGGFVGKGALGLGEPPLELSKASQAQVKLSKSSQAQVPLSDGLVPPSPTSSPTEPPHDVIDDPVQFLDTCHLYNICVPIPYESKPGAFHFPSCVELAQCLGSCCDGAQSCHSQESRPVKVQVVEYAYAGLHSDGTPEFHVANQSYALMERHLRCGCRRCRRSAQPCPGRQSLHGCRCRCPQPEEEEDCQAPREWDAEGCACRCPTTACPNGEFLDPDLCRCFLPPSSTRERGRAWRRGARRNRRRHHFPSLRRRHELEARAP